LAQMGGPTLAPSREACLALARSRRIDARGPDRGLLDTVVENPARVAMGDRRNHRLRRSIHADSDHPDATYLLERRRSRERKSAVGRHRGLLSRRGHLAGRTPPKVAIDIEDVGHGTVKLTVLHNGFLPGSHVLQIISEGWPAVVSSLKTLLEAGSSLRTS
jgi:hypothetical protein